jgi:hypothetical protein
MSIIYLEQMSTNLFGMNVNNLFGMNANNLFGMNANNLFGNRSTVRPLYTDKVCTVYTDSYTDTGPVYFTDNHFIINNVGTVKWLSVR